MTRPTVLPCRLALVVAAFASFAPAAHAHPGELCLPDARPGPQWWSPALTAPEKEARWKGAVVRKLGSGASSGRLRTIWSPATQTANFEFRVTGDPSLDPTHDTVVVALSDGAGAAPELVIEFKPIEDCAVVASCDDAGIALDSSAIRYSQASFSGTSWTWSTPSTKNPNADLTISHPWVVVEQTGASYSWTLSFALSLPLTGTEIAPARRLYGNAVQYDPGTTSGTYVEFPVACTSPSPTSNDCLLVTTSDLDVPDAVSIATIPASWPALASGDGC